MLLQPSGFCYPQLADVDYTENSAWFKVQQGSDTEQDMKKQLHKGGMQDLNVYSARPLGTDGEDIAGSTKLPMYSKVQTQAHRSVCDAHGLQCCLSRRQAHSGMLLRAPGCTATLNASV